MAPKSKRLKVNSEKEKDTKRVINTVDETNEHKIKSIPMKKKQSNASIQVNKDKDIEMELNNKVRSFAVRVKRLKSMNTVSKGIVPHKMTAYASTNLINKEDVEMGVEKNLRSFAVRVKRLKSVDSALIGVSPHKTVAPTENPPSVGDMKMMRQMRLRRNTTTDPSEMTSSRNDINNTIKEKSRRLPASLRTFSAISSNKSNSPVNNSVRINTRKTTHRHHTTYNNNISSFPKEGRSPQYLRTKRKNTSTITLATIPQKHILPVNDTQQSTEKINAPSKAPSTLTNAKSADETTRQLCEENKNKVIEAVQHKNVPTLKRTRQCRVRLPSKSSNVFESQESNNCSRKLKTNNVVLNAESTRHTSEERTGDKRNRSTEITSSSPKHSKRNIASNSGLIEQILNEDDDCKSNTTTLLKKTIFIHNKKHDASLAVVPEVLTYNNDSPPSAEKHTNENDSVYDFISLSQTVEGKAAKVEDPAADIIKKLIQEGRVTVATKRKGTGRPTIKRRVKRTIRTLKEKPEKKAQFEKKENSIVTNKNMAPLAVNACNAEFPDDDFEDPDVQSTNAQSGAFSHLARSVLIHEAKKQGPNSTLKIQEQRRLLDAAHKIVSTPIQKSFIAHTINLSPVQPPSPRSTNRMAGNALPWRVNESLLPTAFNFSFNTGNLPSYSSEHIASTPRKKKPVSNNTHINSVENRSQLQNKTLNAQAAQPAIVDQLSSNVHFGGSSFGNNKSNEENIAPENNFNHLAQQQQPCNPRSVLKKRSPLKAINILEVVNLPPWKNATNHKKSKQKENYRESFENSQVENSAENSSNSQMDLQSKCHTQQVERSGGSDLFGFTEFIDSDENSNDKNMETNTDKIPDTSNDENLNLKSKLSSLKKWRPNINQLYHSKNVNSTNLYEVKKRKQRCINEMLCSTMISTSSPKERPNVVKKDAKAVREEVPLFDDVLLESFENKKPTRTYARPVRKRKKRHEFLMFPISDESDEADEHNSDKEEQHKHKRQRKENDNVPNLETFIQDFNNICNEVEQYNLIIDKSA